MRIHSNNNLIFIDRILKCEKILDPFLDYHYIYYHILFLKWFALLCLNKYEYLTSSITERETPVTCFTLAKSSTVLLDQHHLAGICATRSRSGGDAGVSASGR